jgi:hypothetical protein
LCNLSFAAGIIGTRPLGGAVERAGREKIWNPNIWIWNPCNLLKYHKTAKTMAIYT